MHALRLLRDANIIYAATGTILVPNNPYPDAMMERFQGEQVASCHDSWTFSDSKNARIFVPKYALKPHGVHTAKADDGSLLLGIPEERLGRQCPFVTGGSDKNCDLAIHSKVNRSPAYMQALAAIKRAKARTGDAGESEATVSGTETEIRNLNMDERIERLRQEVAATTPSNSNSASLRHNLFQGGMMIPDDMMTEHSLNIPPTSSRHTKVPARNVSDSQTLRRALEEGAPLATVKEIVSSNSPSVLCYTDSSDGGTNVTHVASRTSGEAAEWLLTAMAKAAISPAQAETLSPSCNPILVHRYCKEAFRTLDNDKKLPLHHCIENRMTNLVIVKLLLQATPESITVPDVFGFTPLHMAVCNPSPQNKTGDRGSP